MAKSTSRKTPPSDDHFSHESVNVARQLSFLEMGDEDQERLRAIAPTLTAVSDEFVDTFYRHLFSFEDTAKFLHDPELVTWLKAQQQSHLESMLDARWDDAYVARRRRVGDVHAEVGIHPRMFLGAYVQYLQFCFRHLTTEETQATRQFVENALSLLKAVFLDIGLTLDAYFAQATQSIRQALEMVFRANTELRSFAHLTSHDLKTPLATAVNLCDEVLDEFGPQLPEAARELVETAKSRIYRMSQTIDELLASTIVEDPNEAEEEFASEAMIDAAVEPVRPLLKEKQIDLILSGPLPWVRGNPVKIREAFYNLVSNAAKFIDKRPGRIEISVAIDGEDCVFCIADNGPGIPHEELTRIFAPFRRLPMHHDRPGSGLGLYFTKNLIEQQSGRIWAESTLGQGSRFYVLLKRHDGGAEDSDQSTDS